MKRTGFVLAAIGILLGSAALVAAAGIPGATVKVVNPADATEFGSTVTDADGAFAIEGLPEGSWRLDVTTADLAGESRLLFAVPLEAAPARLGGRVTSLDGADVSLEVNAAFGDPDTGEPIVLDEGYPRLQRAWNLNWRHANGKVMVRLAGTGLEGLETVVLTSEAGSIESTAIFEDPETGEFVAVFSKLAAATALLPAEAARGDLLPITVGLTTATGSAEFDEEIRIVGPRRRRP